jgi:hypothetical protein
MEMWTQCMGFSGSWKYQSPPWSQTRESVKLYKLASQLQATRYIFFRPQLFTRSESNILSGSSWRPFFRLSL